ncbi:hypothetical protein TREMEDRAFT_70952 [Tremella mesenterica DSM 1558]|uniref:uncharacterized protein n=1 Tax=Tremella mesenterica (strain ATCC 24925 / CBS 8224 / DSM 1558 / NBRC 9311 / NRRL Y-6157 / RJB 2259-6 / UBC 559-6) TaxID=578456 RepID=UPI0003F4A346|nr:uncharacterized protein TREMEDRAFT_70952 [Tremella mesenterica DSM 1558]EIW73335.1 hypothetical protein TREMEDRAFT_70952 [Tremella mesenterica DSM 1558]
MPVQPPTRPHTANPHHVFPNRLAASMTSLYRQTDPDWEEDAWDSSSDKESSPSKAVTISRRKNSEGSTHVAASWASTSYHHVSKPSSSSPQRPNFQTSKTITEGVPLPEPGTILNGNGSQRSSTGKTSKLPPGGAWEIVERNDVEAVQASIPPPKVGKEALRENMVDIMNDPLELLASLHVSHSEPATPSSGPQPNSQFPFLSPGPATPSSSGSQLPGFLTPEGGLRTPGKDLSRRRSMRTERRREKFAKVLRGNVEDGGGVDLAELRRLAWSGVPEEVRPIVWQLLLNYLPLPSQPRLTTLSRKRKEYSQLVDQYFGRGLSSLDQQIWHQIEIDVPRTRPNVPLWSCTTAQRALERLLYVWAIRHPASGYVQGINDLATPFFQVFLSAYIDTDPEIFDLTLLDPTVLSAVEADTFWCLSKLLDGIQDNYISQQPGIQRLVRRMSELVKRIDAPLAAHFEDQGVEFMQFSFRWMNCLLMREMSIKCTIRMWDTYLAEGTDAFSQFHLYVCSALLVKYSERLRDMDFQEMIIFLQNLPTQSWTDHDVQLLLSEAYVLKTVWQGAENHFANQVSQSGFGMLGR